MGTFQIPGDLYTLYTAISDADLSVASQIQVISTAKVLFDNFKFDFAFFFLNICILFIYNF